MSPISSPTIGGNLHHISDDLASLFGPNAYSSLFDIRRSGEWDGQLWRPGMTDKQLLLARLKKGYKEHAPKHND